MKSEEEGTFIASKNIIRTSNDEIIEIPVKPFMQGPQRYGKLFFDAEKIMYWMVEVDKDDLNYKIKELKEEFGKVFADQICFVLE